jgi:hypothetical protein
MRFAKFRVDVQRLIQDAQAELMGVQRDVESTFLFKVKPIVEKVAKDKGLQFVFNLDTGSIAWADPSTTLPPTWLNSSRSQYLQTIGRFPRC